MITNENKVKTGEKVVVGMSGGVDSSVVALLLRQQGYDVIGYVLLEKRNFECRAKFRYRQPDQEVKISLLENNKCRVDFKKPQRAITPGQFAVFYKDDVV